MLLKSDELGCIELADCDGLRTVCRDVSTDRWWARTAARHVAAREARALVRLHGVHGVPWLIAWNGRVLTRSYIDGLPMQLARPCDRGYYRDAQRLLAPLHRHGIVHNDVAKEPNWLVCPDGHPALLDFQIAWTRGSRNTLFRMLAREDLRHLLKHKRTYCAHALTTRQRIILDTPAWPARLWRATGKRAYKFIARRLFGYWDNKGQVRVRG